MKTQGLSASVGINTGRPLATNRALLSPPPVSRFPKPAFHFRKNQAQTVPQAHQEEPSCSPSWNLGYIKISQLTTQLAKMPLLNEAFIQRLGISRHELEPELSLQSQGNEWVQRAQKSLQEATQLSSTRQIQKLRAALQSIKKAAESYPYDLQKAFCYQKASDLAALINQPTEHFREKANQLYKSGMKQVKHLRKESELQFDFKANPLEALHDTVRVVAGGPGSMFLVAKDIYKSLTQQPETKTLTDQLLEHDRMFMPLPKFQKTLLVNYLHRLSRLMQPDKPNYNG